MVEDLTTYKNWSIDESAAVGDVVYGEREDVTYTELPEAVNGAELIVIACDAKNTDAQLATFEAGADIIVYVALEQRVENAPAWLAGWTKTDMTTKSNKDVTYVLWQKEVKAGETVILGTNGQASGCVNYMIFAVRSGSASVKGDADGKVAVADVVMLKKWILGSGKLSNWQNVDMNEDGIIDVFDLVLLKRVLLQKS